MSPATLAAQSNGNLFLSITSGTIHLYTCCAFFPCFGGQRGKACFVCIPYGAWHTLDVINLKKVVKVTVPFTENLFGTASDTAELKWLWRTKCYFRVALKKEGPPLSTR